MEIELREQRLVGLDVQHNVKSPGSPVAHRGLFTGRHEEARAHVYGGSTLTAWLTCTGIRVDVPLLFVHHVFSPPCLCSTLSLVHRVYVPPCL